MKVEQICWLQSFADAGDTLFLCVYLADHEQML